MAISTNNFNQSHLWEYNTVFGHQQIDFYHQSEILLISDHLMSQAPNQDSNPGPQLERQKPYQLSSSVFVLINVFRE